MSLAPGGKSHGSHRVAGDDRQVALGCRCFQHELKVRCKRLERVVAVASGLGKPMASVVVGDDPELVFEVGDLAVPELGRLDPAVNEDERGQSFGAVDAHMAVAAIGALDVDGAPRIRSPRVVPCSPDLPGVT